MREKLCQNTELGSQGAAGTSHVCLLRTVSAQNLSLSPSSLSLPPELPGLLSSHLGP